MGLSNFTGGTNDAGNPPGIPISGLSLPNGAGNQNDDISDLVINYNDKFKTAGTILFRDEVIKQTLSALIGKNKPNALLVGAAGVGKTKIVEDLAFRISSGNPLIPDKLKNSVIYELPLSNVVAGSSFVGELEQKVKAVVNFMSNPKNNAILFIDEIHMLVGDHQVYGKIAQILKPALARGDMRVIGATTLQESSKLMDDPAFNRRFTRLIVDELSREQTVEILKQAKAGFFTHYSNKITFDDDILETCAILADEYKKAGSHRPDNALTLLDRAIGEAVVNRKAMEEAAKNDPAMLQAIKSMPLIPITEKQLKTTAVKLMTGNNKKSDLNSDSLCEKLSVIKGQDDIIEKIVDMLKRDDMNLFPRTTPLTILFAGTSGVGKTEVTKIIAKELTGMKPIILNMTEYHSPASINRIIGAPPGYVGYDSNAESVFDCLESNPYQVILLDEFEKCDKSIQRLFMSAFEEGYIETAKGKTIDFSKSIIIATTNAAHKTRNNTVGFGNASSSTSKAATVKELSQWFDTELLNRFKDILTFHELDKNIYREIVANLYRKEAARIMAEKRRITLASDIPDNDLDEIVETTYVPEFGARPAQSAVRKYIEQQVI